MVSGPPLSAANGHPFDVVAFAASLGGPDALAQIFRDLPADFPSSILVAQHWMSDQGDLLLRALSRTSKLPVAEAEEGAQPLPGVVHILGTGRHFSLTRKGTFSTLRTGRLRCVAPSADLLLESVAVRYADRAIAVVLTGTGTDASQGVRAIRSRGGFVIAQDEATCRAFEMPRAAIETGKVDLVLPLREIAPALVALTALEATG